jgi:hypothetical protein
MLPDASVIASDSTKRIENIPKHFNCFPSPDQLALRRTIFEAVVRWGALSELKLLWPDLSEKPAFCGTLSDEPNDLLLC